jgi:dUTP pyrophosphatase
MIYNYLEGLFTFLVQSIYNILDSGNYLKVKFLNVHSKTPTKADAGCAGYDVFSSSMDVIKKGTRKLISTGISIQIPRHYYLRVAPRSGMSVKGIDVGAGVIDSSYRGELKVLLINNSESDYTIMEGDKIAQLIMERCSNVNVEIVESLTDTSRADGGFGSTGR